MSYATVEAALQGLLQALDRFADRDVRRGDFGVLDTGGGACAVLYQGRFRAMRSGDYSQVHYTWSTYVEVYEPYTDQGGSLQRLEASVQDVCDTVGANPTAGGVTGISNCWVADAEDVQFLFQQGERERPSWCYQRVRVQTEEEVLYAGSGEFA